MGPTSLVSLFEQMITLKGILLILCMLQNLTLSCCLKDSSYFVVASLNLHQSAKWEVFGSLGH